MMLRYGALLRLLHDAIMLRLRDAGLIRRHAFFAPSATRCCHAYAIGTFDDIRCAAADSDTCCAKIALSVIRR